MKGAMLVDGVDFTENPTTYTLAVTPTNSYTILQQQTFAGRARHDTGI